MEKGGKIYWHVWKYLWHVPVVLGCIIFNLYFALHSFGAHKFHWRKLAFLCSDTLFHNIIIHICILSYFKPQSDYLLFHFIISKAAIHMCIQYCFCCLFLHSGKAQKCSISLFLYIFCRNTSWKNKLGAKVVFVGKRMLVSLKTSRYLTLIFILHLISLFFFTFGFFSFLKEQKQILKKVSCMWFTWHPTYLFGVLFCFLAGDTAV